MIDADQEVHVLAFVTTQLAEIDVMETWTNCLLSRANESVNLQLKVIKQTKQN